MDMLKDLNEDNLKEKFTRSVLKPEIDDYDSFSNYRNQMNDIVAELKVTLEEQFAETKRLNVENKDLKKRIALLEEYKQIK